MNGANTLQTILLDSKREGNTLAFHKIASFQDMMNHDACAGTAVLGMRAGENPATIWQGVEGDRVGGLS
jgi:hypothetical protein